METYHTPNREEQALAEVGHTVVTAWVSRVMVVLFLVTVSAVVLAQTRYDVSAGRLVFAPLRGLVAQLPQVRALRAEEGFFAANRALLAAMHSFEDRLEEESFLRETLLPPVQLFMTSALGLGNEQAYVGRDGWLFYRPDVDYVTGPSFLEEDVLQRRARGGDAWETAPRPDPLPALVEFNRQLGERDIRLVVLPTPVKPMIHPEFFSLRRMGNPGPNNPSYEPFLRRLEAAGIAVIDVVPLLDQLQREQAEPLFLRTDTHWTPQAMNRVAEKVARDLEGLSDLETTGAGGFLRREVVVENLGDVAVMLRLPTEQDIFPPETIRVPLVLGLAGKPWRPQRSAEVLLLGDSFSNIYSEPGLGWGSAAGLAEQLSYHLERPVDKIALNAGGSHATREALARELASGRNRLAGKKIVVYQFAVRELSIGDWKMIDLGPP